VKVLVTGGTGFVGSHTVAALVRAGHDVRLLARRPQQVSASLEPLGVDVADVVPGDVLDEPSVSRALDGCDAVVHAAAVYTVNPRRAEEIRRTNVRSTELVLGRSVELGIDPVVYVSSTVALLRYGGTGPDLPLGDIDLPYSRSKIDAEKVARRLQDKGAPIVSVYPGYVYGPHDPYLGDNTNRLRWLVRRRFPIWPKGGLHTVDIRDVARLLTVVLEPGRGPRRYIVPGHHVDGATMYGTLRQITGRRYPHVILPGALLAPMTRLLDAVQRPLPDGWRFPAEYEAVEVLRRDTRFDDSAAREEFGIEPRSLATTLRETVQWLAESGNLPTRYGRELLAQHD
jgi:dihydroflavonol-4-reductase